VIYEQRKVDIIDWKSQRSAGKKINKATVSSDTRSRETGGEHRLN